LKRTRNIMGVIIATVGEESASIVESIKRYPCDKLVLLPMDVA